MTIHNRLLCRVMQLSDDEFDLLLSPDTGTTIQTQKFYFKIRVSEDRPRYRTARDSVCPSRVCGRDGSDSARVWWDHRAEQLVPG